MFEKVILKKSVDGNVITSGEIAEALLFYQNVCLVFEYGSLISLVKSIGTQAVLSILKRPNVSAIYCEQSAAAHTSRNKEGNVHNYVAIQLVGDKDVGKISSKKELLMHSLKKHGVNGRDARNFAEFFKKNVPYRKYSTDHFVKGGVINAANEDLADENYVNLAVKLFISSLYSNYPDINKVKFAPIRTNKGYIADTNINFKDLNSYLKNVNSNTGEITEGTIFEKLLSARVDLVLASRFGGEFYTSELSSGIICLKHRELLQRIGIEKEELMSFNELILENAPSIKHIINSGEKSINEFFDLLEEADKFKSWLTDVNPDEKMVKEYFDEIRKKSWLNKFQGKVLRYVLHVGHIAAEPISGTIASFADAMYADKLWNGWKPNHFIDKKLRPFIGDDE